MYDLEEHRAGATPLRRPRKPPVDADNPYAPPRDHVGAASIRSESATEALRRNRAQLESFAKAVGVVCLIFAVYEAINTMLHAGWVILTSLGVSSGWPYRGPVGAIAVALGAVVAVTGFTAGIGLRRLRWWSSSALGIFGLAVFSQFVLVALNDQQLGHPQVAVMSLVLGAIPLVPVAALLSLDLGAVLSEDHGQVVANTPAIDVRAKLPAGVKYTMALLLVVLIGVFWAWN